MLTTLTRAQFADRIWDTDDFATAVTLLAHVYEAKRKSAANFALQVSLWGWARQDANQIRELLQARCQAYGFAPEAVTFADTDTLTVLLPTAAFTDEADRQRAQEIAANALSLVADAAFDGLCAELRVSSRDKAPFSLIFYGQIRGGRFHLRAVYPSGAGEFTEDTYSHAVWPKESLFVRAVHEQQTAGNTPMAGDLLDIFPDETGRLVGSFIAWYLQRPKGKRAMGLLIRLSLSILVVALCLWMSDTVTQISWAAPLRLTTLGLLFIASLGFAYHNILTVSQIISCRRNMVAAYRKIYAQAIAFRDTFPAMYPEAFDDPAVLKMTRDVESMGMHHVRDVTPDPPLPNGQSTIRVFQTEDREVLFSTLFLRSTSTFRVFPAKCNFHCRTHFDDGSRLISVNGGIGYRKPDPLLPLTLRVFTDENDPAAMLEKHRREVTKRIENGARRVVPVDPEQIISLLVEDHEQARQSVARRGYFGWGDAVRMVFDAVRPEYRA